MQAKSATVLVDACVASCFAGTRFAVPEALQPPDLTAQLTSLGVVPGAITHVVITHAHFDHYSGVTTSDTPPAPRFPRARYVLGRADWEFPKMQTELARPDSLEARTLGVLVACGQLDLVTGNLEIAPGIEVVPAPGETPGHQMVRVDDGGQVLYVLGDLYHHPWEVSHPDWAAQTLWADPVANRASRQRVTDAALVEEARLLAAHIPGVGCFGRTAAGVQWKAVS